MPIGSSLRLRPAHCILGPGAAAEQAIVFLSQPQTDWASEVERESSTPTIATVIDQIASVEQLALRAPSTPHTFYFLTKVLG